MNLLSPFGWLYGRIVNVRNTLYDRAAFAAHALGARTISIGNITTGGTGKTPLVALIAEILADSGEKVCILTRGYGRKDPTDRVLVSDGENVLASAKTGGDEPVELAIKLLGKAIVIADPDRVAAAKWALEKFGVTVFLLDDGFQHRRAKRDLDIVCIDATDPFGGGTMLPTGRLREPIGNLGRADAIVITRAKLSRNIDDLRSEILVLNPQASIFVADNSITRVLPLEEFYASHLQSSESELTRSAAGIGWERLRAEIDPNDPSKEIRLMAFCALGNPDSFFFMLEDKFEEGPMDKFELDIRKTFPDHHTYSQENIYLLEKQAKECKMDAFLTTAKDAVKLKGLKFEIPCYVVEIESVIEEGEEFNEIISAS